jgi:hypothetical protein
MGHVIKSIFLAGLPLIWAILAKLSARGNAHKSLLASGQASI